MNSPSIIPFRWDDSYAEKLPGFYVSCDPEEVPDPALLRLNTDLAEELGLSLERLDPRRAAQIFSGNELPGDARPLAQAYAGHQFGNFVPQLGDGRALLLGEVTDRHGRRRDIVLKGSGRTPFSRGGDGKAAVGPVLREYLIGEAMHALRIPTTRALAAVGTGEFVRRERPLPGAILTRVAASHVRVGTFEYFAARRRYDQVRELADFVIQRHDPHLLEESDRYLLLLKSVAERQAALLAQWMLVGFIHGVMNTDNMAISGETIDYGPCAFMENYGPRVAFSSIDIGGRYAFGNQPLIARWNLTRFAEALLPLIDEASPDRAAREATDVIENFIPRYEALWLTGARAKLGLTAPSDDGLSSDGLSSNGLSSDGAAVDGAASDGAASDGEDRLLVQDWLDLLEQHGVDYTLAWRRLSDAAEGGSELVAALFPSADDLRPWLERWRRRLAHQPSSHTAETMRAVNPIYIPRNHLVEEALTAASEHSDLSLFERMLDVLAHPYEQRPGLDRYAQPAPREYTSCYRTFCGT